MGNELEVSVCMVRSCHFCHTSQRRGGQTWGEALSLAGPSLQLLNPGPGAAMRTCTGAQSGKNGLLPGRVDKWRRYQAQEAEAGEKGKRSALWRTSWVHTC